MSILLLLLLLLLGLCLSTRNLLLARLHSVGGQYCFAVWRPSSSVVVTRCLSSSVIVCNTTAGLQVASTVQARRWRHTASTLIIAPR